MAMDTSPLSVGQAKAMLADAGITVRDGTEHDLRPVSASNVRALSVALGWGQAAKKALADYTWAELADAVHDNSQDLSHLVGQTRDDAEIVGKATTVRCIGIGQDVRSDGSGTRTMTFQTVDCVTSIGANSSSTSSGGYASSKVNSALANWIMTYKGNLLEVMVGVSKPCAKSKGASASAIVCNLFIPSEYEVLGTKKNQTTQEGERYQWYAQNDTGTARVKYLSGSTKWWWLRSVANSTSFCTVDHDGSLGYNGAANSGGIAPCFCI